MLIPLAIVNCLYVVLLQVPMTHTQTRGNT